MGWSGLTSRPQLTRTSFVSGSICALVSGSKFPIGVGWSDDGDAVGDWVSPRAKFKLAMWKLGSVSRIFAMRGTCVTLVVALGSNSSDSRLSRMPIAAVIIAKCVTAVRSGKHISMANWKQPGGTVIRDNTWLSSWQTRFNSRSLLGREGFLKILGAMVSSISRERISDTVSSKHIEQILSWRDSKRACESWRCALFWIYTKQKHHYCTA